MVDRRSFLAGMGAAALGALAPPAAAKAVTSWPSYRKAMAIDGLGGVDLFYLQPDDPQYARTLQDLRACGLNGVVMTAAPQGRFWLDDAALHATRQRIDD